LEFPQGYRQSWLRSFIVFLSPSRFIPDIVHTDYNGSVQDGRACTKFIWNRIRKKWWAVVKTEMNLGVYKMLGISDWLKNH
jgi:hypothetical protein